MAVDPPAFFPFWAPPPTLSGLVRRAELKRQIQIYVAQPLDWQWSESRDWPDARRVRGDFRRAREGNYGFVAVLGSKRVFLVPRGFETPEWALADTDLTGLEWRDLGDIEPAPVDWSFPPLRQAPVG